MNYLPEYYINSIAPMTMFSITYDKLNFLRISENPRLRVNTFNDVVK